MGGAITVPVAVRVIGPDSFSQRGAGGISLAALALAATASPVAAALPPREQRAVEMRAILDDPAIAAALEPADAPIKRIEWLAVDLYRLTAGRCTLDVKLEDMPAPNGRLGGRLFRLRPGILACAS